MVKLRSSIMKNSEVMFDAQECIDEVIELIGDEHLYYLIDGKYIMK